MIYTKTCPYCHETFQSISANAIYCKPSHRSLMWAMNHNAESQTKQPKDTDKKLLYETEEEKKVDELKKKYPDLLSQLKQNEQIITELRERVADLEAEAKEEHNKWKNDPEEHANHKIKIYTRLRKQKGLETEEEPLPTEVVEKDEQYEIYRRRNFMGILYNSWEDRHCEIVRCKETDEIHKKQLLRDGFKLSNERKI